MNSRGSGFVHRGKMTALALTIACASPAGTYAADAELESLERQYKALEAAEAKRVAEEKTRARAEAAAAAKAKAEMEARAQAAAVVRGKAEESARAQAATDAVREIKKELLQKIQGRWGSKDSSCHGWEYVFENIDAETIHFVRYTEEGFYKHESVLKIESVTDHQLSVGTTVDGKYMPGNMTFSWSPTGELSLRFKDDKEDRILNRCE